MSYKCCKCTNILYPQGPIMANVVWKDSRMAYKKDEKVLLNDDLQINNLSFLHKKIEKPEVFTLEFDKKLSGQLKDFRITEYKVTMKSKHVLKSQIVICCDNCGNCCSYDF